MFTEETGNEICRRLALGETLRQICKTEGMPAASTVCLWVSERPPFAEQYARARGVGLDSIAEELLEIADDTTGDPHRDRLRIDARKWLLSKMRPEKYGDRVAVEQSGTVEIVKRVLGVPDDAV